MTEPIISIRGLVNRFGRQTVHNGLDLDIMPGEILGIVGGSGTGKSVLLRSMLGLRRPEAGSIVIEGRDITRLPEKEKAKIQRTWGVSFQNGALFSSLTVAQNIALPLAEFYKVKQSTLEELTELKLKLVGLPISAGAKHPSELSGGMRKRAGLARALALDPDLVFLDEPTAGLDPISASEFDRLLVYLRDRLKLTVVMITHDLDTLFTICDRIAALVDGKVVAGSLDDLLASEHPWIRKYFHGPRARSALAGSSSDG